MELVKDIQDLEGDRGYKKTLPTLKGKIKAVVTANMFCFLPIIGTLMYPNRVVTWTALFLVPIAFNLGLSYFETRPKAIYWAEKWGDAFVATVIVVLFIVQ